MVVDRWHVQRGEDAGATQREADKGKLTLAIIEDLKAKGFNQSRIAEMYGVTRQHVSWIKHTYGGRLTPRELALQHFPWKVPVKFFNATQYKLLRHHAEYMVTQGEGMSSDKLARLRSFYHKLRKENLVVEFDPANPPEPGMSTIGGFVYRRRTDQDGDLLVRLAEGSDLSEEQKAIWRYPDQEP